MNYVLSIQFEAGTDTADHDRVLKSIDAADVSSGGAVGAYNVVVQLPATTLQQLQDFKSDLQSLPEVKLVDVVAVQLPTRQDE